MKDKSCKNYDNQVKVYDQCTSKCLVAPYTGQKSPKAVTNLGLGNTSLYKNVPSMRVISGLRGDNTDNISVSLKNRTPPALITADAIISYYHFHTSTITITTTTTTTTSYAITSSRKWFLYSVFVIL